MYFSSGRRGRDFNQAAGTYTSLSLSQRAQKPLPGSGWPWMERLSIPGVASITQRRKASLALRPWLRDAGQMLALGNDLYDIVRDGVSQSATDVQWLEDFGQ